MKRLAQMLTVSDSFMKNVYTVFDMDKKAVGFAALANGGASQ